METHILEKEKMESLKILSDVNIKISDARSLLFKLQEDETLYLIAREKKAMDRIKKVVDESKEMVLEADKNHAQINELFTGVCEFSEKLIKTQEIFKGVLADFDERNELWEKEIGKQQDDLVEIRKQQKVIQIQIENDKQSLDVARQTLVNDQRKLDSDRGTVERAILRLKQNKI